MKFCTGCKEEKPVDMFGLRQARWSNDRVRRNWCKKCHSNAASDRATKNRAWVTIIKENTPCMDCGCFYRGYIMEYHHRPDETKIADVSKMCGRTSNPQKILDEIAKCDLVCANCHRERTHGNSE